MKKSQKTLSVCIEPKINKILEDMGFNKSKLINKLLSEFIITQKQIPENLLKK